jgi:hypothetical protein
MARHERVERADPVGEVRGAGKRAGHRHQIAREQHALVGQEEEGVACRVAATGPHDLHTALAERDREAVVEHEIGRRGCRTHHLRHELGVIACGEPPRQPHRVGHRAPVAHLPRRESHAHDRIDRGEALHLIDVRRHALEDASARGRCADDDQAGERLPVLGVAQGVIGVPVRVDDPAHGLGRQPPDLGDLVARRRRDVAGVEHEHAVVADDGHRVPRLEAAALLGRDERVHTFGHAYGTIRQHRGILRRRA